MKEKAAKHMLFTVDDKTAFTTNYIYNTALNFFLLLKGKLTP